MTIGFFISVTRESDDFFLLAPLQQRAETVDALSMDEMKASNLNEIKLLMSRTTVALSLFNSSRKADGIGGKHVPANASQAIAMQACR